MDKLLKRIALALKAHAPGSWLHEYFGNKVISRASDRMLDAEQALEDEIELLEDPDYYDPGAWLWNIYMDELDILYEQHDQQMTALAAELGMHWEAVQ